MTRTGNHTASHLVSAVLVPRERTVQQQRTEFVQLRQSGRGPTLLRRVHAAPADTAPLYDTFQKHSNVSGLLSGSLFQFSRTWRRKIIFRTSKARRLLQQKYLTELSICHTNLRPHRVVTLRIFKLFSPSKITHNNRDENQPALITVFFICTVQGSSPPARKQECSGGDVGHLKNVVFKRWQLQLILHWFTNLHISCSYTYVWACVHKLPLSFR